MKAAYQKFEEDMIKELKQEYPTLKMSQLKEKIWKEVSQLMYINNLFSGRKVL